MNRFDALIAAGIPSLSATEMAELEGLITQIAVEDSDDTDPATLDRLVAAADAAEALRAEAQARAVKADAARQRVRGESGEPVTAAAPPKRIPLSQVRQTPRPDREAPTQGDDARVTAALVAAGGLSGDPKDASGLADLLSSATRQVASAPAGTRQLVARSTWTHPVEVKGESPETVAALLASAQRDALVAAGGLCGPGGVDYTIPGFANVDRPLKAALPAVSAARGSLTFSITPAYSAAVYGQGVAVWTAANDASPGGANTGPGGAGSGPTVKPSLDIDCGSTATVTVSAITQMANLRNFQGRFNPETVEAQLNLLATAWAATAEAELLRSMRAAAKHVSATQAFGATRDMLSTVDRACAYLRDLYRLSDNVTVQIVLKRWVRNAIRGDLAKAAFAFTSGDPTINSLAISDAQIDAWFAVRGITPVWVLDDDTNDQTFASVAAGSLGAPNALPAYPTYLRMLAFPANCYQFLDGGELNLGVVRDSNLNAVNKYQIFSESFEAVAFRGFEALDIRCGFASNGASAGTVTPA